MSTYHYKSRRTGQVPLERRIKEICETRVRYGYRRVHVHLRRDGWKINMKKTRRIYSELGLQLRNKHPKRRVKAKLRDDRQEAVGPNDVWAMPALAGVCWQTPRGGLRSRPTRDRQEVAHPDRGRLALALLPGRRRSLHLSRRGCRPDPGRHLPEDLAIRRRSGRTMAASSSPETSTCGPMPTMSPWTSRGPASRPITASSRPSTASCGPNA